MTALSRSPDELGPLSKSGGDSSEPDAPVDRQDRVKPGSIARQVLTGFDRRSRRLLKDGNAVAALRQQLEGVADAALAARWSELTRNRSLPLHRALAVCAEITRREVGLTPNPSQLATVLGLARGCVVELPTGEGKTLAGAMAAALVRTQHESCHVMSANEYLAQRDAVWMAPVYERLGLTVSSVAAGMYLADKRAAYLADVTYGTAQEIGFDYLRDGLRDCPEDLVQRGLHAVIVDEADAVLIDEARQPLVISQPGGAPGNLAYEACGVVERLAPTVDFQIDHERMTVALTDAGAERLQDEIGADLFSGTRDDWLQAIWTALRARGLYERGRDYIVRAGTVEVVDEYTGRTLVGRRWNEGLHQAIEIKERLLPSASRRSVAEISIPSLISLYAARSGMTATAVEEEAELARLYRLEVMAVQAHRPLRRVDLPDSIYETPEMRNTAVVGELRRTRSAGRPVLVGCASVNSLSQISEVLDGAALDHERLDARNEAEDAAILGGAGRAGAATLTTQLAGRGVDIRLDDPATEAGGLHVLGVDLFESPRIERQLRGRAARQGDPGSSRYTISLQDPLLQLWGLDPPPAERNPDGSLRGRKVRRLVREAQWVLSLRNRLMRLEFLAYDSVVAEQYQRVRGWHDEAVRKGSRARARELSDAWMDHLSELNALRDGIGLRTLGGESPLSAWTVEANQMFRRRFDEGEAKPTAHRPPPSQTDEGLEPVKIRLARLGPRLADESRERVRVGDRGPLSGVRFTSWGGAPAGGSRRADVVAVADADGSPLPSRQGHERDREL